MKRHFADAFFFFAWWNRRDRAHGRVEEFLREFDGHLLTTRWVLMEVADGLASTPARREVRALFAELESDPMVVVLFKLGDAFTSELRTYFFLKLGFEKATYAAIQWPFGFFSVLIGGYIGGVIANRVGVMRALWIGGIAQMATNLIFIWPAVTLPDLTAAIGIPDAEGTKQITFAAIDAAGAPGYWAFAALAGSVGVENFATGIGGAAFVAYMSMLCGNRNYTATQYALLSSLASQARISLSAPAGFAVAAVGWVWYYIIATALAIPGLLLLWWLMRRDHGASLKPSSEFATGTSLP